VKAQLQAVQKKQQNTKENSLNFILGRSKIRPI